MLLFILLSSWTLLLCVAPPATWAESDKITIYSYSSETSINNFKLLKMEFDSYLSRFGPYELQPVKKREDFERYTKGRKDCLLLISSWHFGNIGQTYSLKPALVGLRNGKKYQKRILTGRGASANVEDAKTARIASAASDLHTKEALSEIFKGKDVADRADILTVPKDIDALMSVSLGMCQYALTTEGSLEDLKQVNPFLHRSIKVVAEGRKSLLLILAFPESSGKVRENMMKLVKIVQHMPLDPDGRKKIKMFGLDGWQPFDSSDKLTKGD